MAGRMYEMGAIGDHLYPFCDETVDDPHDGLLVSRYRTRGENHTIAGRKGYIGMIILSDARQCCPRLTLAAGTQRNHLVGRQVPVHIDRPNLLDAVKIAD